MFSQNRKLLVGWSKQTCDVIKASNFESSKLHRQDHDGTVCNLLSPAFITSRITYHTFYIPYLSWFYTNNERASIARHLTAQRTPAPSY